MRLLVPTLLALVLVPAALSASPRVQTISGTISANSGSSITVTSGDRSVTCAIPGAKAQAALVRWGVGAKAAMACTKIGDHLLLSRLSRLGTKEPTNTTPPATTRTTDDHGTTAPAPAPVPPTTTTVPDRLYAVGVVTSLSSDGVTVKPDQGGDLAHCRITTAADSTAAAAKLSLGAHASIDCRRDGTTFVLAGASVG